MGSDEGPAGPDDGRVVEEGTHDELLAVDGLYAYLWKVQVGDVEGLSPAFVERARQHVAEVSPGLAEDGGERDWRRTRWPRR